MVRGLTPITFTTKLHLPAYILVSPTTPLILQGMNTEVGDTHTHTLSLSHIDPGVDTLVITVILML
jgi:hypothetical protein